MGYAKAFLALLFIAIPLFSFFYLLDITPKVKSGIKCIAVEHFCIDTKTESRR